MSNNELTALKAGSDLPVIDLSKAPMPTQSTLRHRHGLIGQFFRFVGFDLRIMRMVVKGHK